MSDNIIGCLYSSFYSLNIDWCKLLLNNINGKMYKVIYNMYQNIKSRIVYNNAVSDFFDCNNGVRQEENLSLSFSRYI